MGVSHIDSKVPTFGVRTVIAIRAERRAALTVFVGFEDEQIKLLKGEPRVYRSSAGIERAFCEACGTSSQYRDARLPNNDEFSPGSIG